MPQRLICTLKLMITSKRVTEHFHTKINNKTDCILFLVSINFCQVHTIEGLYAAETSHSQHLEIDSMYIICSGSFRLFNLAVVPITIPILIVIKRLRYLSHLLRGPYTNYNILTSSPSTLGSSSHISQILVSQPVQMSIQIGETQGTV